VRTLEQIVEQIRAAAGADFAFVLTRKGRLVTHRAPRDMPDAGRDRLVRAAKPLLGTERVLEVPMPREELVPYGGAAPIDVYIGVVNEQAVVCVVMASWADKMRVAPALEAGMKVIAPLLRRGLPATRRTPDVEPAKGSPYVPDRTSSPPPSIDRTSSPPSSDRMSAPPESGPYVNLRASLIPEVPKPRRNSDVEITLGQATLGRESLVAVRRDAAQGGSAPEIIIGEAPLGRESLVAIQYDAARGTSLPEIILGEAALGRESLIAVRRDAAQGGSAPEIIVGEAALGRESLVAIHAEAERRAPAPVITMGHAALGRESLAAIELEGGGLPAPTRPPSSPEAMRVELVSMPEIEHTPGDRVTLPWVEAPAAAKRAADAARLGRKLAAPHVTIRLEDEDGVIEIGEAPAKPRS
jgi:hypothetical protein